MIIDQTQVHLKAGNGGDGAFSFARKGAKSIPDGGNGGQGADIIIRINQNLYDLNKFRYTRKFIAPSGGRGNSRNKTGKDAAPLYIDVPQGTIVKDMGGHTLFDLNELHQEVVAAVGGSGGKGNYKRHFKRVSSICAS